ncbi:MAG: LUD domain-containing protein [Anaerolineales bacterium]
MIPTTMLEMTDFGLLASDAQIERTMQALEANNIHAILAEDGVDAKKKLFEVLPPGAEVFTSSSITLDALGITGEINNSGRYRTVRAKLATMDRGTQSREMDKLGATPEYMLGSVHAVTESGCVIVASATGSQLAGYVSAAAHVIWVVGTQKIVPTIEDGMKRLEEYVFPLEDARAFKAYGMHSAINKLLIINKEFMPRRVTMILVKEKLGF